MVWFWTDDLARLLVTEDGISRESISDWINHPIAIVGEGDGLSMARALFIRETATIGENRVA